MPIMQARKLTPLNGNPLYEQWLAMGFVRGRGIRGYDTPFRHDSKRYIREFGERFSRREKLTAQYSWAIPTDGALAFIAEHSKQRIVEIGAGRGYWAKLLTDAGCDVAAFDKSVRGDDLHANHWHSSEHAHGLYFPVEKGTPEVVANYPDRALLLCWAPYDDPMAANALKAYRGRTLIWIGEGWGGCCGNDHFWNVIEKQWEEIADHALPQWPGIHDYVTVYHRKPKRRIELSP